MNLQASFTQSLKQRFPGIESQRVLLAVSGGPDSMALLYLFSGFSKHIAVAHCNFGLRGTESDADELFVKQHCSLLNIPFYTKRFETKTYATEQSMSIQLAARELRYLWFEELRAALSFDYIATAHHLNDNIETVLMNIVRGTGIKGVSGIPEQNVKIIRPLLFADKEQLIEYLNLHNIPFRIDASNSENKYTRNKLRNSILPQLLELNPQAALHINQLSRHAQFAYFLIREKTEHLASLYLHENNGTTELQYDTISQLPFAEHFLYELVAGFGFNTIQCDLIHANFCAAKTGSRFLSETTELIIDRKKLILTPASTPLLSPDIILNDLASQTITLMHKQYEAELTDQSSIGEYLTGHLYINADLLSFPLHCRVWKQGDSFQPLGSFGTKKVSDFLIDKKVNLNEKRNTYILAAASGEIIALLDHRIDNRYKITPATKMVLHIKTKGDQ